MHLIKGVRHSLSQIFAHEIFKCPLCSFSGKFLHSRNRLYAECPRCHSLERHRLQYLCLRDLEATQKFSEMRILHLAPEPQLSKHLRKISKTYLTADLARRDVDYQIDICKTSFPDSSFDLVFASHVLEHIESDLMALQEIHRILSPSGIAILPVPIVRTQTLEYERPDPREHGHVRAPGFDYFDRYSKIFRSVVIRSSAEFPRENQLYVHTFDKEGGELAINKSSLFTPMKIPDFLPLCFR